jgi:hypothetical protein
MVYVARNEGSSVISTEQFQIIMVSIYINPIVLPKELIYLVIYLVEICFSFVRMWNERSNVGR